MDDALQDRALLQEFITESEELLQGMDQDLIRLESDPQNPELLNRVFRALHSVKGTAGFFALEPIVRLGHKAEDLLTYLRRGQLELNRPIMDALLASRDLLGKMLIDLRHDGLREYPLEPVLALLEQAQSQTPASAAVDPASVEAGTAAGRTVPPAPADLHPNSREAASMRVQVSKLDDLVDLIGELVLERNRLLQLMSENALRRSGSGGDSPLCQSIERLSVVTEELQSAALKTRMVPMQTVFSKFPRLVRDLAQSLQKDVELVVAGEDTEIDKTLVESIGDPLVHLVRNALDHGIETPEMRQSAGKPRKGTIRLEAQQRADHILVTVVDDGKGIDTARVLEKAVEKKLVAPERTSSLSQRDILDFIFAPGFSTVQEATDLSGRGVGMDVVRSNLKKINGTVAIESALGFGTTVQLSLPLTLAILPVLLVQVGEELYALPLRAVVETCLFSPREVHAVETGEVICLRNQTLPLVRLHRAFACLKASPERDQKIVVLSAANERIAVLVDKLVGQESTVVKPLNTYLNQNAGIVGASIAGNGEVRLVVDPSGLLPHCGLLGEAQS